MYEKLQRSSSLFYSDVLGDAASGAGPYIRMI